MRENVKKKTPTYQKYFFINYLLPPHHVDKEK